MTRKKKKKHSRLNSRKLQAAKTILQEEQSAKRKAYLRFQGKMAKKSPKASAKLRSKPKRAGQSLWQRLIALFKSWGPKAKIKITQEADKGERNARPEEIEPIIRAAEKNLGKIKQMIADCQTKQCTINAIELPVFELASCSDEEVEKYRKELEEISKVLRHTLEEEESKRQEALSDCHNKLQLWRQRLETAHQHNAPSEILTSAEQRVDSYANLQATLEADTEEFAKSAAVLSKSIEDIETQIWGIKEAMKRRKQEAHF